MYFHGLDDVGMQVTRVATSRDGIDFAAEPQILGRSYMRVFPHDGMIYAMAMPGFSTVRLTVFTISRPDRRCSIRACATRLC